MDEGLAHRPNHPKSQRADQVEGDGQPEIADKPHQHGGDHLHGRCPQQEGRSLAAVAAGQVDGGAAGQVFFWIGLAATVLVAIMVTRIASRSLKAAETSMEPKEPPQD